MRIHPERDQAACEAGARSYEELAVLEQRLERLLVTLGICYGQDEEAAVLALIGAVVDAGGNPTAIARAAAQQAPKWRLSEAERQAHTLLQEGR